MADDQTSLPPPPIPNSYWVLPGRLLAGEYPGGASRPDAMARIQKLLQGGVTSFVDLTEEEELPPYQAMIAEASEQPVRYRRLEITDHSIPESHGRMSDILDHIDAELQAQRCVYVHCRAGIGRTGTTIACHLIRSGLANEDALERLQTLWRQCARSRNWPTVPETSEQIAFVRSWRDRELGASGGVELRARYEGAIVGLAVGDALGTLVATSAFDAATLASLMRDSHALASGADTAMTRAVLESLLAFQAYDPTDQLQRYLEWTRGATMPIPPELKKALAVWQWSKKLQAGSHDPANLDPHTLARSLAPALFLARDAHQAMELAAEVSRTTLQSPVVLDLCRLWAATLVDALLGANKLQLSGFSGAAATAFRARKIKPPVRSLVEGRAARDPESPGDAIAITLHAHSSFRAAGSFKDAVLHCVTQAKLGASAAALCGALAGAHFGIDAIPTEWRAKLGDELGLRSLARHCLK